jgi:hypothetical protein
VTRSEHPELDFGGGRLQKLDHIVDTTDGLTPTQLEYGGSSRPELVHDSLELSDGEIIAVLTLTPGATVLTRELATSGHG